MNGKKIPPLLGNNKLITDFKVKANLFNGFFHQQCTTVEIQVQLLKTNFETEGFLLLKFALTILLSLLGYWTLTRLTVMMEYQFLF